MAETELKPTELCSDCPPADYPTDKTRCLPCPRRRTRPTDAGEAVAVKPLEWRRELGGDCFASSPVGTYCCPKFHSEWDLIRDGRHMHPKVAGVIKAYPTLEAAKAAAQADYEKRIRSALVAHPSPSTGQDVDGLVERTIRGAAVASVDGCHGYTYEFAPSPAQHLHYYDMAESAIRHEFQPVASAFSLLAGELREVRGERDAVREKCGGCVTPAEHAEAIAALAAEVERLTQRSLESRMLAHGWMEAHDKLHAHKSYNFPKPADLPDSIARAETAESTVASLTLEVERLRKVIEPFAKAAISISRAHLDGHAYDDDLVHVRYGDLCAASESLNSQKGGAE